MRILPHNGEGPAAGSRVRFDEPKLRMGGSAAQTVPPLPVMPKSAPSEPSWRRLPDAPPHTLRTHADAAPVSDV